MGFFSFLQSFFRPTQTAVPTQDEAPSTETDSSPTDEAFAMNSDMGHVVAIADLPIKSDRSVLDSRWPPFPRAVQVLSPKHLIDAQAELVRNLCSAIPLSDAEVELYLMPVVWNLACFVHLLPASAHHHHRGLGGLFGHSLETAIFASQTAKNKIFDFKARPEDAYMNKARWILACALAGLMHDVGKAVLDIRVYSDQGTWHPTKGSITEWCRAKGIEAYYVAMNEDREHNKHEQASLAYARVLIPRRTYLYLSQTGNSRIEEELHAAINGQREGCLVGEILGEADQLSVKLDERRQGSIDPRDKLVTTPLADAIVKAMRVLIKEGTWTINVQNAHLWLTTQGCFIDWSDVSDITKVLAADNVRSVPHDNGAMAGMLLTEGLIEAAPGIVSPDERFWPVCPLLLKDRTVTCVKFRVPVRLIGSVDAYEAIPVYVPNLPMLEADIDAWTSAYGFDPSAEEHQQVEEEDYLAQLLASVSATPAAYQSPGVGFYTTDAQGLPSLASFLPTDDPSLESLEDPDLDLGHPPAYITELEAQLLQSDFYREDAPVAEEESTDAVHVSTAADEPTRPAEAANSSTEGTTEIEPTTSGDATKPREAKQVQRAAVVVDAAPTLKVVAEQSKKATATDTAAVVSPEAVTMPIPPSDYDTLDVSEDRFALLLPGKSRHKAKRSKGTTVQTSPVTTEIVSTASSFADPTPIAPEPVSVSVTPLAKSSPAEDPMSEFCEPEEDEFGGLVVDEALEAEDLDTVDEVGCEAIDLDVALVMEDVPFDDEAEDARLDVQPWPTNTSHEPPSFPAEDLVNESVDVNEAVESQASVPEHEKKDLVPTDQAVAQSATVPSTGLSMSTVDQIAEMYGANHRQAAQALMSTMKAQMLARRGDLLTSQVWKNIVGFVTDDKGFKAAMEALAIPVPVMAMTLAKYQPMPKLEWDREAGKVHLKVPKEMADSA